MKKILKKSFKKAVIILIYSIVLVPNFIIGFIQGFESTETNRPA